MFIGIDVSKDKLDICYLNFDYKDSVFQTVTNDEIGFDTMLYFMKNKFPDSVFQIAFEATSTYMVKLQQFLFSNDLRYILLNPFQFKSYIKSQGYESKTDKLDSYYISKYASTFKTSLFSSYSPDLRNKYKRLNSYLELLKKMENQLVGFDESVTTDSRIDNFVKLDIVRLSSSISVSSIEFEKLIIDEIRVDMPEYDLVKNDIAGVGDKTMLAVFPLIYGVSDKYTIKQLQSFIGLNPVYFDSGSSINKKQKMSKRGDSHARKMLYMSAVSSVRYNPILIEKYQRLLENGKPKKLALSAIAAHIFRAIVHRLNYHKANKSV